MKPKKPNKLKKANKLDKPNKLNKLKKLDKPSFGSGPDPAVFTGMGIG